MAHQFSIGVMGKIRRAMEAVILVGVDGGISRAVPALGLAAAGFEMFAFGFQVLLECSEIGIATV